MVTCYPVMGKRKSYDICAAFAQGCGGKIANDNQVRPGPAFFYGVDASNESVWRVVKNGKLPYFYCDNSYFDQTREKYFRVTKNALQHSGIGKSTGERWRSLGIPMQQWRKSGQHIVICPQSGHFMRTIAGLESDWLFSAIDAVRRFSSRAIRIRDWMPDKGKLSRSLPEDLLNAHALVTWSSAAAVTSVLSGVPVVAMGPSAAAPMAGDVKDIECLPMPERGNWAGVLADNQWTVEELRSGKAWEQLQ